MDFDYKSIRKVDAKEERFQPKANVNKQKNRCKLVANYLKLDSKKAVLQTGAVWL